MENFNIINQLSVLEGEGRGSRKQEMKAGERSEGLKSNLIPAVPSRKKWKFFDKIWSQGSQPPKKELEKE